MQPDPLRLLPLEETLAPTPNEPTEARQVASPEEHKGSEGSSSETSPTPARMHRPFPLPPWPTSQPGPGITALSPGQRLVPFRTDQVMYDCYDQERGMPGPLPPIQADAEQETPQ